MSKVAGSSTWTSAHTRFLPTHDCFVIGGVAGISRRTGWPRGHAHVWGWPTGHSAIRAVFGLELATIMSVFAFVTALAMALIHHTVTHGGLVLGVGAELTRMMGVTASRPKLTLALFHILAHRHLEEITTRWTTHVSRRHRPTHTSRAALSAHHFHGRVSKLATVAKLAIGHILAHARLVSGTLERTLLGWTRKAGLGHVGHRAEFGFTVGKVANIVKVAFSSLTEAFAGSGLVERAALVFLGHLEAFFGFDGFGVDLGLGSELVLAMGELTLVLVGAIHPGHKHFAELGLEIGVGLGVGLIGRGLQHLL